MSNYRSLMIASNLKNRKKSIIINAKIIGDVYINSLGIAKNLNDNNYIEIPIRKYVPEGDEWELYTKIKIQDTNNEATIFSCDQDQRNIRTGINIDSTSDGHFTLLAGSRYGWLNGGFHISEYQYPENVNWLFYKIGCTDDKIYGEYSTDNRTWVRFYEMEHSPVEFTEDILWLGKSNNLEVDLEATYLKVNGEEVWKCATINSQLENCYIESNGEGQYIDVVKVLGDLSQNDIITCTFQTPDFYPIKEELSGTINVGVFGGLYTSGSKYYGTGFVRATDVPYTRRYMAYLGNGFNMNFGQIITGDYGSNETMNDKYTCEITKNNYYGNDRCWLFANNDLGGVGHDGYKIRIWEFSVERNGKKIINLVPTKHYGEAGFKDLITGKFLLNDGSGALDCIDETETEEPIIETGSWTNTTPSPAPQSQNIVYGITGQCSSIDSEGANNPDVWTNGVIDETSTSINSDATLTFNFDKPEDIAEIRIYSKWGDSGRDRITINKIEYTNSKGTFTIPNTTVDYDPDPSDRGYVYFKSKIMASQARSVTIYFGDQENGHVGYSEIEILRT